MRNLVSAALLTLGAVAAPRGAAAQSKLAASLPAPLRIGQTFTIRSRVLGETRRINVYLPAVYADSPSVRLPVLYMPDGGIKEDFLHVAGLVQVSAGNGTMRPFILVGIENTQRRRDLTGPTTVHDDSTIAPVVGGSAAFRRFIRTELMPLIRSRYRTTGETAIVGESLAGLFVVETFLREPDLFDTYIAFDPSLWWNDAKLVDEAGPRLAATAGKTLYRGPQQPARHRRRDRAPVRYTQGRCPCHAPLAQRLLPRRDPQHDLPPRRGKGVSLGVQAAVSSRPVLAGSLVT